VARIFVVDDKQFFHQMYRTLFELEGHRIVGNAYNGQEAVVEYKKLKQRPDIVIMDHLMPVRNGLEAASDILQYDPEAKIIFVSVDQSIAEIAVNMGAKKFITKPFHMDRLLDDIKNIASSN